MMSKMETIKSELAARKQEAEAQLDALMKSAPEHADAVSAIYAAAYLTGTTQGHLEALEGQQDV